MNPDIAHVLSHDLILTLSEHPKLRRAVEHYASTKKLVRVLGNSYAHTDAAGSLEVRVAAARATYPNCVFTRETAARLSWWPELAVQDVQLTVDRSRPMKGFAFERRVVPAELRTWDKPHFLTNPALTVLDLSDTRGGEAIDEALRRGVVTLEDLHEALALTAGRRGNRERARLLAESRHEPWSELERQAHVLLRQARFPEWVANHPVELRGKNYCIDLAVPGMKLAAEVDGWKHHKTFESFVSDRKKWNELALDKWLLLHFTANTMGELASQMRQAYEMRKADIAMGLQLTV